MKTDKDYLTQLVLFEISGKIGEEEKTELNRIIGEDPEAHDLYFQLHALYDSDTLTQATQNWGPAEVWSAIRKKQQRRMVIGGMTGVTMLLLLFMAFLMFSHNTNPAPALADKGHIRLQLSGGQIIDLNNQQGAVITGGIALNSQHKELWFTADSGQLQFATLTVPAGKDYTVHLPDGSEVQLNAETQLLFPLAFSHNTREITIRGEAYLKIAPVANQPFIVHLPGASVQVLGTEFNVNTYDSSEVRVALVKGAVKMNTDMDTVSLKPGFESTLTVGENMKVYRFDPHDVMAWRHGIHLFNHATPEEVARLIHRFYGVTVHLDLTPDYAKTFTGSIDRNNPVTHFLDGLKYAHYLDYHFSGDSILYLTNRSISR
jgi:ferric-dicitrate binding protein FerR (iron transport regulator)